MGFKSSFLTSFLTGAVVGACLLCVQGQSRNNNKDWNQFGFDLARTSASTEATGITAANVGGLQRRQVQLDGTVDAAPIYLHGVSIKGGTHNAYFATTTYGKTIAIDADAGTILWEYTPPGTEALAGSRQITNSTPAADPDRTAIYAASPDGKIEKLSVADGHELWSTAITLLPLREKMDSPLSVWHGHVIAVTAGYIGDRPPYQGHVSVLDAASGKVLHTWNSLCSNRQELMKPDSCASVESAIWGRAGAVLDASGDIFVATGNGPWNGTTDWGDAVLELAPDATGLKANYTPTNTDELNDQDLDVGSTSPVLLGGDFVAQGGKDNVIRLLSLKAMAGTTGHKGGELQTVPTPSGKMLFTAPAVWRQGGQTWMFAADGGGTAAWTLSGGKLVEKWKNQTGGTSPVVAGGLLYVYDPKGGLAVYQAGTGKLVTTLECGAGHWNSPIVADGKIAVPEGNANRRLSSGVLDIWGR